MSFERRISSIRIVYTNFMIASNLDNPGNDYEKNVTR